MNEPFQHPFTCVVPEPTSCGKKRVCSEIYSACETNDDTRAAKNFWCYDEWQCRFDSVPNVEFIEGLPQRENFDGAQSTLLILDDLMNETNRSVTDLFTKGSHHRDLSVVYIVQSLFKKRKRTLHDQLE